MLIRSRLWRLCLSLVSVWLLSSALPGGTPTYGYTVVARLPHAADRYTEGFFYRDGLFYEGTGLTGHSAVLVTEPVTGRVVEQHVLAPEYFGEGIVDWGANLYEWTWQTHTGFIYERKTLKPLRQFTYDGEGWGMTRDTHELITSDGSSILRFRNPETFAETHRITVHDGIEPVTQLNELEYVKGVIYANVWRTNRVARISPESGKVLSWIDLSGLLPAVIQLDQDAVLNGIAYDAQHDRLYVTGKQWPTIFEIKVNSKPVGERSGR